MTITSYAQNFEDVMLSRALHGVNRGFYIDIGAHHPGDGSVTKAFYDAGWSGINIEPTPDVFQVLDSARSRDINLNICVGAYNGQVDFFDVSPSGLATIDSEIAQGYLDSGHQVEQRTVAVQTLTSIAEDYNPEEVHFLKIDVEGAEKSVLEGADFKRLRPWIIVVEATLPNSQTPNFAPWEHILLEANYSFAYFDGLNRFYVAKEHNDLMAHFAIPPNYFDGFALAKSNYFVRHVNESVLSLEDQLRQATQSLGMAQSQIESMRASKSWQVTSPLRASQHYLTRGTQHLQMFSRGARSFLHKLLRPLIIIGLKVPGVGKILEQNPQFKSRLINYIKFHSGQSQFNNRFPELFPMSANANRSDSASAEFIQDYATLTSSARRLFHELDPPQDEQHESEQS